MSLAVQVSIIMPAYNAAPWIGAALESVRGQSLQDWEVLVIDDGSTDGTDRIAHQAAAADPRIRVLAGAHRGAAAARNRGLEQARGHYIQHLDADDLLAPDKLDVQLAALQGQAPGTVASGRWIRFRDDHLDLAAACPDALWQDHPPARWLQLAMRHHLMMHPAAWLVPRAVIDAAGAWDERLSLLDDGEFFARVLRHSPQVHFVPAALSWYRSWVPGSLSGSRRYASAHQALQGMTRSLLALDDGPRSQEAAAWAFCRLAVEVYPQERALSRRCLADARSHDPAVRPVLEGGPRARGLARWLGWRGCRWLQHWLQVGR